MGSSAGHLASIASIVTAAGPLGSAVGAAQGLAHGSVEQAGLGALTGGISEAASGAIHPATPDQPQMPGQTPQSGGQAYSQALLQRLAASAGGTMFSTPHSWWGQQVGADPNAPRKSLVGA